MANTFNRAFTQEEFDAFMDEKCPIKTPERRQRFSEMYDKWHVNGQETIKEFNERFERLRKPTETDKMTKAIEENA